jgi:hypothetical protein
MFVLPQITYGNISMDTTKMKNLQTIGVHIVIFKDIRAVNMTVCWLHLLFQFSNF